MKRHCEVTWGAGSDESTCPHPAEYIAVSIGGQQRNVYLICAQHKALADGWSLNWATARLPKEAAIGNRTGNVVKMPGGPKDE